VSQGNSARIYLREDDRSRAESESYCKKIPTRCPGQLRPWDAYGDASGRAQGLGMRAIGGGLIYHPG